MHFFCSKNKLALLALTFSLLFFTNARAQMGGSHYEFLRMVNKYQSAKDRGKNTKSYLRYSIGGGLSFTSAKYEHSYQEESTTGALLRKNSIIRNTEASAFHINASVYYPLMEISETSILAFNFGVNGYVLNYEVGEVKLINSQSYDYTLTSMQIGIPLCMEYKYGGEALIDKSYKTSFSFGIGLAPIVYANKFGPVQKLNGGIRPFLRAEVGFFAGIEWKITGSCLAGNAKTMNIKSDELGMESMPNNSTISLNSKPIFSIGISFMPFSYDWENFGW